MKTLLKFVVSCITHKNTSIRIFAEQHRIFVLDEIRGGFRLSNSHLSKFICLKTGCAQDAHTLPFDLSKSTFKATFNNYGELIMLREYSSTTVHMKETYYNVAYGAEVEARHTYDSFINELHQRSITNSVQLEGTVRHAPLA